MATVACLGFLLLDDTLRIYLIATIAPGMIAVSTILIRRAPTSIAIRSAKGSIRILRAQHKPELSVALHVDDTTIGVDPNA